MVLNDVFGADFPIDISLDELGFELNQRWVELCVSDQKRYLELVLCQFHAVIGHIVHVVDLDAGEIWIQLHEAYDAFLARVHEHEYGAHEGEQAAEWTANRFGPFQVEGRHLRREKIVAVDKILHNNNCN